MPNLTIKGKRFVDEYLIDLNGTQAAIRAGYSPRTANEQAARLLANVSIQAYLQIRRENLQQSTEITQERVLKEFARIAFFQPKKLFDSQGKLLPIHLIDPDTSAMIAGFDIVSPSKDQASDEDNGSATGHQVVKIKFNSRQAALDSIARHLGLYHDEVEVKGSLDIGASILAARRRARLESLK